MVQALMARAPLRVAIFVVSAWALSTWVLNSGFAGTHDGRLELEDIATPANSARRIRPRRSTAFIVKTYGEFTEWQRKLIKDYHSQLSSVDIDVGVLRDVSAMSPGHGQAKSLALHIDDITVPQCDVSWRAAGNAFGWGVLEGFSTHLVLPEEYYDDGMTPGQGSHNAYEALWWRDCAPLAAGGRPDFVWFVEHDAVYNGDVSSFLLGYARDDADIIASGFRIAGPTWWNFQGSARALGGVWMRTFPRDAPVVPNVTRLPSLAETECQDPTSDDEEGLIFAQDVVERLSWRAFGLLELALRHGVYGPAETLLPTLCATCRPRSWNCTMVDFAPLQQRSSGSTPVSPQYCWNIVVAGFNVSDLCKPQYQDKWVHPLKYTNSPILPCLINKRNLF